MIQVLIADDHPIVRRGLVQIVSDEPDLVVAAETGNSADILTLLETGHFEVLVLDVRMPGVSGLEMLSLLRTRYPKLPVLMLSAHSEAELAIRALRAGAAGYLNKELAPEELVSAIRRAASGRKYVNSSQAELLAESLDPGNELPHALLSDREYQVMKMIGSGKTVTEIAEELGLSVKTVSTYRTRILEKLSIKNTAELMLYAIRNDLIDR